MKPLLKLSQKYSVLIILVIIFAIFAAVSGDSTTAQVDDAFGAVVAVFATALFSSVPDFLSGTWWFLSQVPLIILVLMGGAIFFTFRFAFINVRGLRHAIDVVRGKYDDPNSPGEVSHFQALTTALSATVGLGNIAGVAIAVGMGGPGAVFWMMVAAVFGMTSKFAECTLGQMYRKVDSKGNVQGGPMVYLRDGLAEIGLPTLGKYLSIIFAVLCIGGSFGGGNMFQSNQSFQAMSQIVPWLGGAQARGSVTLHADAPRELSYRRHLVRVEAPASDDSGATSFYRPVEHVRVSALDWKQSQRGGYELTIPILATESGPQHDQASNAISAIEFGTVQGREVSWNELAGVAVLTSEPVTGGAPSRAGIYGLVMALLVGLVIVGGIKSIGNVASKIVPVMCATYVLGAVFVLVTHYHAIPSAVGVIISEAFNPAAGLGGLVGVLIIGVRRAAFSNEAGVGSAAIAHSAARTKEPVREGFVALLEPFIDTLIICFMTGIVVVITGVYADPATSSLEGVELTSAAFETVLPWFPIVLSIAVVLFAFSTMISWSYYGERCWAFLFGPEHSMTYRIIFLFFVWLGAVSSLSHVIDFSDLMLLSMAFPNILGMVLLSRKIHAALESYWERHKAGKFETFN